MILKKILITGLIPFFLSVANVNAEETITVLPEVKNQPDYTFTDRYDRKIDIWKVREAGKLKYYLSIPMIVWLPDFDILKEDRSENADGMVRYQGVYYALPSGTLYKEAEDYLRTKGIRRPYLIDLNPVKLTSTSQDIPGMRFIGNVFHRYEDDEMFEKIIDATFKMGILVPKREESKFKRQYQNNDFDFRVTKTFAFKSEYDPSGIEYKGFDYYPLFKKDHGRPVKVKVLVSNGDSWKKEVHFRNKSIDKNGNIRFDLSEFPEFADKRWQIDYNTPMEIEAWSMGGGSVETETINKNPRFFDISVKLYSTAQGYVEPHCKITNSKFEERTFEKNMNKNEVTIPLIDNSQAIKWNLQLIKLIYGDGYEVSYPREALIKGQRIRIGLESIEWSYNENGPDYIIVLDHRSDF